MIKRILCTLLACVMLSGLIPLQAFAQADFFRVTEVPETNARVAGEGPNNNLFAAMPADMGDICVEEAESNDSPEQANTISDNRTVFGRIDDSYDVDYYRITLSHRSYLNIIGNSLTDSTCFALFHESGEQEQICTYYGILGDNTTHLFEMEISSLTAGTYYLAVYDKDGSDVPYVFYVNATPPTPKINVASNLASGIKISWSQVSGAKEYEIYRRTYGTSEFIYLGSSDSADYTDTSNTISGCTYTYYVLSRDTNTSCLSDKASVRRIASKAIAVTRLTTPKVASIKNVSSGIYLKWNEVTGATGYRIYRQKRGSSAWTLVDTVSSKTLSYVDKEISSKNGSTYSYRIRAIYKNSQIHPSTIQSGYSTKTIVRLRRISVRSLAAKRKGVDVSWSTRTGVTGYQVRIMCGDAEVEMKTYKGSGTSRGYFRSLIKGKTYTVQVRTYKSVSGTRYYSAWSDARSVKPR